MHDLIKGTILDVNIKLSIGKTAAKDILNRHISQGMDWNRITSIPVLGLDEIALKKGVFPTKRYSSNDAVPFVAAS